MLSHFSLHLIGCKNILDIILLMQPKWRDTPLTDIRDNIDRDFYALSCAYYERYVVPHFTE